MIRIVLMRLSVKRTRLVHTVLYFVVSFAVLFYYTSNDYFCSSTRTGQSHALVTARLALACTTWNLFASACGILAMTGAKKFWHWSGVAPLVSTLIAGAGFAYLPFWIFEGYGKFRFENTWGDVSCFFTEANGLAFPFVVAPALAATTLISELLIAKARR
jgi:hypothetical protein